MEGSDIRRWGAVLVVVVIAGAAYWFRYDRDTSGSSAPAAGQSPQGPDGARHGRFGGVLASMQAAIVTEQTVPRYFIGLGTVMAANVVTVHSRVNGQLLSLHLQGEQQVKAGDLLARIDPSQFKVVLVQAQGQLAKDNAILTDVRRDLACYQQLAKANLVSCQELDARRSLVVESVGTAKADKAVAASAQLQLDWTRIVTPIGGRVGLKQVDIGNQIFSGDATGIVVLTQTRPIDVVFTLPENSIATMVQTQKAGKALNVKAWGRTNKRKIDVGELLGPDNQISVTTGTIRLKAHFSNLGDTLFPNQFVSARLPVDTEEGAAVIPTAALQMDNEGYSVRVLNGENKVSKHSMTPGIQDSQKVVIGIGLSAGDRAVTGEIDRLVEGAKAEVVTASGSEQTQPVLRQSGRHGTRS